MNRRQKKARLVRRVAHHQAVAQTNVLKRRTYPPVKNAHIVPRFYQRNFAVHDQVDVWSVRDQRVERRNTGTAGTRRKFYRRVRPDGSQIDDVEATLSVLEGEARDPLYELVHGEELDRTRKAAVAQLFGMQLARGPHFFESRSQQWKQAIGDLGENDFTPAVRRQYRHNAIETKRAAIERQSSPTPAMLAMLRIGSRLGGLLANMRWHLLRTPEPWLAYSDHPVVVWPAEIAQTVPFPKQQHGPGGAMEVRAPLSPNLAVVMTWRDAPDPDPVRITKSIAAELNAFTTGQADRQWMYMPDCVPPIASGEFVPVGPRLDLAYGLAEFETSHRRRFAVNRLRMDSAAITPKHFQMLEYTSGSAKRLKRG